MKMTLNRDHFVDMFRGEDGEIRKDHGFSIGGLYTLWDYFENCDWTEYSSIEEALECYGKETREELEDCTIVLDVDGTTRVIVLGS